MSEHRKKSAKHRSFKPETHSTDGEDDRFQHSNVRAHTNPPTAFPSPSTSILQGVVGGAILGNAVAKHLFEKSILGIQEISNVCSAIENKCNLEVQKFSDCLDQNNDKLQPCTDDYNHLRQCMQDNEIHIGYHYE